MHPTFFLGGVGGRQVSDRIVVLITPLSCVLEF